MNIFLIDGEMGLTRRRWDEILPQTPINIKWQSDPEGLNFVGGGAVIPENGVIIIHDRSAYWAPRAGAVVFPTLTERRLAAIFLSGTPLSRSYPSERVYRRRAPVSGGCDKGFADCFQRFWSDYTKNGAVPNFGLLEPLGPEPHILRLLSEAWLLTHSAKSTDAEQRKRVLEALGCGDGILSLPDAVTLAAPASRSDWLTPFQAADAAAVAAQMPDDRSQAAAKEFFEAFVGDSPEFAHVADLFLTLHALNQTA